MKIDFKDRCEIHSIHEENVNEVRANSNGNTGLGSAGIGTFNNKQGWRWPFPSNGKGFKLQRLCLPQPFPFLKPARQAALLHNEHS